MAPQAHCADILPRENQGMRPLKNPAEPRVPPGASCAVRFAGRKGPGTRSGGPHPSPSGAVRGAHPRARPLSGGRRLHRGGHANGFVNSREIIVHIMNRHGANMVLKFFRKAIG